MMDRHISQYFPGVKQFMRLQHAPLAVLMGHLRHQGVESDADIDAIINGALLDLASDHLPSYSNFEQGPKVDLDGLQRILQHLVPDMPPARIDSIIQYMLSHGHISLYPGTSFLFNSLLRRVNIPLYI